MLTNSDQSGRRVSVVETDSLAEKSSGGGGGRFGKAKNSCTWGAPSSVEEVDGETMTPSGTMAARSRRGDAPSPGARASLEASTGEEYVVVLLQREPGESLGIGLSDDPDGENPIISELISGKPAERSGEVFLLDRLVAVNGLPPAEGSAALRDDERSVELTILPSAPGEGDGSIEEIFAISLSRDNEESFGLAIGYDDHGPVISALEPSSAAARSRALQVYDRLLSVNGQLLTPDMDVRELMDPSATTLNLEIARDSVLARDGARREEPDDGKWAEAMAAMAAGEGDEGDAGGVAEEMEYEVHLSRTSIEESLGLGVGFDENGAALLLFIAPDSPASRSGQLEINDQVTAVNGQPTAPFCDFPALLSGAGLQVRPGRG